MRKSSLLISCLSSYEIKKRWMKNLLENNSFLVDFQTNECFFSIPYSSMNIHA